jgi:hypothetical protein
MCTEQTYLGERDILIQPQIVQLINLLQTKLVFGQHLEGCTRESVTTEDIRCGGGIGGITQPVAESDRGREKRACSTKGGASRRAALRVSAT